MAYKVLDVSLTPESNFTGVVVQKHRSKQHQLQRNNPSPTQVAAYKNGVGLRMERLQFTRWRRFRDEMGRELNRFPGESEPLTLHFLSHLFTSSRTNRVLFHAAVPADIVRGTPNPSQWVHQ
ncbi:hypothetical protein K435DRAFT_966883 [Dendrothele bispora CBS 962.96]|uniref:Uncharacterized protein n=1 Tax=Dendrothele bispora (strain CBS 962.96) TaxID=1314807 RepID=A0A4S8LXB1_DENBC|nr:hypothetical protein K435DRAFT_966883 [Dendrothele bispora CBS 962.96]